MCDYRLYGKFLILQKKEKAMTVKTFTAVLHREEDMYVAECPELGTVSQGFTMEEALTNLKEATELYLEEFPLQHAEKPFLTTFEVAVNA
jgi:predicted RNase H-like HicB family nuclease